LYGDFSSEKSLKLLYFSGGGVLIVAWIVGLVWLVRSWKTLALRQRWLLVGACALSFVILIHLSYELEILNQIESIVFSVFLFIALPFLLFLRSCRFRWLWLRVISVLTSILIFAISALMFLFYVGTNGDRKIVAKFDSEDGFVYVVREEIAYGFHSDLCRNITQHRRVLPGLLIHRKTFDQDIDSKGWLGCGVGSADYGGTLSSIKLYFRVKL
jgi:hypothetical protein